MCGKEEKIIDGVDVAGCEFLENDEFDCLCLQISNNYEIQTSCKNKDCYYKQLKRLEQQRDKYKHALEEIKKISRVNPVDSCWTLLYTCDNCSEKSECNNDLQSPFTVIRKIENIITEAIGE